MQPEEQGLTATQDCQLQTERARSDADQDGGRLANLQDLAAFTQAEFFKVSEKIKAANPGYEKMLTIKPRELKKGAARHSRRYRSGGICPLGEQLYIFVVARRAQDLFAQMNLTCYSSVGLDAALLTASCSRSAKQ